MTRPTLLIATTNRGKQRELGELLGSLDAGLVFPEEMGIRIDVTEDGATYRENAAKKARVFAKVAGLPALADDSGLEVDALGGEPGVRSARYAGEGADDARRRAFLLERLRAVPVPRAARFVCVIAVALPGGELVFAEGECRGEILLAERGVNGFGYDPIFRPAGKTRTLAELSPQEKNLISHRARAARAAIPILREFLPK
jgi:XTP/dITP diphosphohydrolase